MKKNLYFVIKIVLTYYCEKNCSSDREKLLKFEAEGREFAKFKLEKIIGIQKHAGKVRKINFNFHTNTRNVWPHCEIGSSINSAYVTKASTGPSEQGGDYPLPQILSGTLTHRELEQMEPRLSFRCLLKAQNWSFY